MFGCISLTLSLSALQVGTLCLEKKEAWLDFDLSQQTEILSKEEDWYLRIQNMSLTSSELKRESVDLELFDNDDPPIRQRSFSSCSKGGTRKICSLSCGITLERCLKLAIDDHSAESRGELPFQPHLCQE